MTNVNLCAFILIGGFVGVLIADIRGRSKTNDLLPDIVTGFVGSVLGVVLLGAVGGFAGNDVAGVNMIGGVAAFVVALVFVGLVEWWRNTEQ